MITRVRGRGLERVETVRTRQAAVERLAQSGRSARG